MSPTNQIYIEGFAENTNAEIRLNDISVMTIISNQDIRSVHVEEFLLPGKNFITLIPASSQGNAATRLTSYNLDEFVDGQGGEALMVVRADKGASVTEVVILPFDRPQWMWLNTDIIDNDASRKEAIAYSKSFYKSLVKGDISVIIPALQPQHIDYAKLSPDLSVIERNRDVEETIQRLTEDEIWQFDNIEGIEFDVIAIANGHLFLVQRKDGSPLFRTSQPSRIERYTFSSMIGKKDGKWAFYR
ncbi:MAG: hypothetical protein GY928_08025 [Colwellia sp.]|nr:hypothetical protein [Colwellia sp.]